ncbi:MFS transporter [Streptomyces sp. NPDC056161]|uniref:MFS transporter n=1 Tax=Streptomyces sp. NPDC056161 TaxID=3345732 RepID=UPI0035D75856
MSERERRATRRRSRHGPVSHLAGALAARTGDEMSGPALMLAGLARTGSAAAAAALLAGVTVAAAVGGPVLGALLDRVARPGRLLATALVLYAAGLTSVLLGLGRLPFPLSLLLAVVTGLLGPALSGGWTAQLPHVVPADRLPRANALDAMTFGAASLAGPALAGGAAAALGAPTAVLLAAALIGVAVPAAWLLPTRPPGTDGPRAAQPTATHASPSASPSASPPASAPGSPASPPTARPGSPPHSPPASRPASPPASAPGSVSAEVAAGLRAVVDRPRLARATLTSVVACVGQGMVTACLPLLGERALGGADRGATLLSCAAASALAANALLARFPRAVAPDTVLWAGCLLQAVATALAVPGRPVPLIAAAVLTGVAEGPSLTALFAVRHREAPAGLRGQIFTTGASLKITAFALGAALAAPLAARSLPLTMTLAAGTAAAAALTFSAFSAFSAFRVFRVFRVFRASPALSASAATEPYDVPGPPAAPRSDRTGRARRVRRRGSAVPARHDSRREGRRARRDP